jgi:hypothetical protein
MLASFFGKALLVAAAGEGADMDRFKARNEARERWLAETAEALACAERLAARLAELRNSSEIGPVLLIQSEIADLRQRVDQLDRQSGRRQEFDPEWMNSAAWPSLGVR